MRESQAMERAAELRRLIETANEQYYILDNPTLSDAEYDHLMEELRSLEHEWPALASAASPTQRVGAASKSSGFEKTRHIAPMLSLANAFTEDAFAEWVARVGNADLFGELKLDGASLALRYEDGVLVRAATRGDGTIGEIVTGNAFVIPSIPRRLARGATSWPNAFEVRGEVLMPKSTLARVNRERIAAGLAPLKNCRNAAAGSLRQMDPQVTATRGLEFYAYSVALADGTADELAVATQEDLMAAFSEWGFQASPMRERFSKPDEAVRFAEAVAERRETLDFDIDGVVFKVNDLSVQRTLGSVGREPRWAIARKWPAALAETTLLGIEVQIGRTGQATPVAVLSPVEVGGTTIQSATLHNSDYIATLDLRIGDRVLIKRAGEVIPQVERALTEKRTGQEQVWTFPANCPRCSHLLVRESNADGRESSSLYCANAACPAQATARLRHFVSRAAMDIRGLGDETVEQLVGRGLVHTVADLYRLTVADLLRLDGFAATSAENLLAAIDQSRTREPRRIIYALGVFDVGESKAELLAEAFGGPDELAGLSESELMSVPGVGEVVAQNIRAFFADPSNQSLLQALKEAGLRTSALPAIRAEGRLTGMTFVITGTLSKPREVIAGDIKASGGKVSGSVSAKTSYLVAGESAGSKLDKAISLGVSVLSEAALYALIGGAV